jgi:hypothetical protein
MQSLELSKMTKKAYKEFALNLLRALGAILLILIVAGMYEGWKQSRAKPKARSEEPSPQTAERTDKDIGGKQIVAKRHGVTFLDAEPTKEREPAPLSQLKREQQAHLKELNSDLQSCISDLKAWFFQRRTKVENYEVIAKTISAIYAASGGAQNPMTSISSWGLSDGDVLGVKRAVSEQGRMARVESAVEDSRYAAKEASLNAQDASLRSRAALSAAEDASSSARDASWDAMQASHNSMQASFDAQQASFDAEEASRHAENLEWNSRTR